MLLTPAGEDSIAVCPKCGYSANVEAAPSVIENQNKIPMEELKEVDTPGTGTIEELCNFLKVPAENTAKAVVYQRNEDDSYVVAFIRGDLDIHETKLTNALGCKIHPAVIEDDSVLTAGFIGPVGINEKVTVIFDNSLKGIDYLVTGANKVDTHYTGFNVDKGLSMQSIMTLQKLLKVEFVRSAVLKVLRFHEALKWVIFSSWEQNTPNPWDLNIRMKMATNSIRLWDVTELV